MTAAPAPAPHPIDQGHPPEWAVEWGEDRYGVFASFQVEGVQQRMRWIPHGRFWMGSPEDEVGRRINEGPRHLVNETQGFWLAETPCTQELWVAVMAFNPSKFKSPQRPVERVTWRDCEAFFGRMRERDDKLRGRLPTEEEWEYACRAGTETATWAGDLVTTIGGNEALLDGIAWYQHNSGSSTEKVGLRQRNPWGLYDILGNVNEWCADCKADYSADGVTDPDGSRTDWLRAYRGGSWLSSAPFVRSAYRHWYRASGRDAVLGFRLILK